MTGTDYQKVGETRCMGVHKEIINNVKIHIRDFKGGWRGASMKLTGT